MRIKTWHQLCLAASCLGLPVSAFAQTSDETEIIYITAARIALPADQATSSITLLDADLLEALSLIHI